MGGLIGAYGVRLLYGEVCLSCNKKLNVIPNYQYLTPTQMKDVMSGKVSMAEVKPQTHLSHPEGPAPSQTPPAEEIRQYKQLLDEGIISQEEFEAVKRRLMNI